MVYHQSSSRSGLNLAILSISGLLKQLTKFYHCRFASGSKPIAHREVGCPADRPLRRPARQGRRGCWGQAWSRLDGGPGSRSRSWIATGDCSSQSPIRTAMTKSCHGLEIVTGCQILTPLFLARFLTCVVSHTHTGFCRSFVERVECPCDQQIQ